MTWVGAAICFVFWVGYGALMARKGRAFRAKIGSLSRGRRVFLGSAGLILGMVFLVGALYAIASLGGAGKDGVALWAWPLIGLAGLGFVHAQVVGAAALATLALDKETPQGGGPSGTPEN